MIADPTGSKLPNGIKGFFGRSNVPLTLADVSLPDQPIILANPAFCRLTGFDMEDIHGRNCRFLQGSETESSARAELRDAIREVRDCQVIITNYRKTGERFQNFVVMYALKDEHDKARYFLGSQFDVSGEVTASDFGQHITALDDGVANITSEFAKLKVKTRQLLSESVVRIVMRSLGS